jgi:hypothetical protein
VNSEPWTPAQCARIADIMRWEASQPGGAPLEQLPDSRAGRRGWGPHRLGIKHSAGPRPGWWQPGGEVWSNALGKECPGDAKVAQVPQIIQLARSGDDMPLNQDDLNKISVVVKQWAQAAVTEPTIDWGCRNETRTHSKTSWYSTGGPWGTGLLLLGVAVTVQGVAYLIGDPNDLGAALRWVGHGIPIRVWRCCGSWPACTRSCGRSPRRRSTPTSRPRSPSSASGRPATSCSGSTTPSGSGMWAGTGRPGRVGVAGALIVSWSRCVNPPTGRR